MVFQFLERLSDRQEADAMGGRINWKFALRLSVIDPEFHFSVLAEFPPMLMQPCWSLRDHGVSLEEPV